jgi:alpha-mannosidase
MDEKKKLFHEKSEIGHFSGNKRDFGNEYDSEEPEEEPNDALDWIEKAKTEEQQKIWSEKFKIADKKIDQENTAKRIRYFIGNSHMDMAWLWRYLQTVDKTRITFTKACVHIENIPDFSFSGSQSIMFEWCRLQYPELFERVKKHIKGGQFELVGGSWVEPDTHIPSGEAWVRQRLHGQLYYWKHFGKYATIDWVPDSFGFTNSIPQIMLKSNTPRFHTGKLADNDTNPFPFSTFWWESPDGSRVLAELGFRGENQRRLLKKDLSKETPAFNYESTDVWTHPNFSDENNPHSFEKYGKGDGGHGPTGEEVQTMLYLQKLGVGKLTTAGECLDIIEKEVGDRIPVWKDELYYEYHRGTLTSLCLVKRMNRYNECILPALESLCTLASLSSKTSYDYPYDIFDEAWKVTLFNQFHDTLPGTCIIEVYDDCWDMWCWQVEQYEKIQKDAFDIIKTTIDCSITEKVKDNVKDEYKIQPILLYNPISFENSLIIRIPRGLISDFDPKSVIDSEGNLIPLDIIPKMECPNDFLYEIPESMGFKKKLEPLSLTTVYISDKPLETDTQIISSKSTENLITITNGLLEATFDKSTAAISSLKLIDGEKMVECIESGNKKFSEKSAELEPGIKIQSFNEISKHFPAWNMDKDSRKKPYQSKEIKVEISEETNNHITITSYVEYPTPNAEKSSETDISTVKSNYTLFRDDPLLYLDLDVNFHSQKTLFKLDIPTTTGATRIDAETAYAHDNRSTIPQTDRDKARWENHMHQWVNIQASDDSFGFAVINNGKYGLDYRKGYLGITLIHGQSYFPPRYTSWVYEERFERSDAGGDFPPSWIDQGQHIFQLALYPHLGTLEEAEVINKAHCFNSPALSFNLAKSEMKSESKVKLPQSKFPIEITTIKPAHLDSEGLGWVKEGKEIKNIIIIRAVNMSKSEIEGLIDISKVPVLEVREGDLLERQISSEISISEISGNLSSIGAIWKPFEIKTFGLLLKSKK